MKEWFLSRGSESMEEKKGGWNKGALRLTTAVNTLLTHGCFTQIQLPAINITAKHKVRFVSLVTVEKMKYRRKA